MSLKAEKKADLLAIVAEVGEPVIWNGRTLSALVSVPAVAQEFEIGGFMAAVDFTVKIPLQMFSGIRPKHGDRMTFEGNDYRVTRVSVHPQYPMLVLTLSNPDE